MKKYFLFAAVAGMLASCSSDSLIAGSDPKIEPTNQEDLVPIEINVASVSTKATTRGVGTVGGTNNDPGDAGYDNYWQGEKVNVFMFDKGTLLPAKEGNDDLFNNTQLTTKAGETSAVAQEIYSYQTAGTDTPDDPNDDSFEDRIKYRYYPPTGNYDFWGYYIDDATTTGPSGVWTPSSQTSTKVTVPFEIDGTQDLMVAKTVIDFTGADAAAVALIDNDDTNEATKKNPAVDGSHSTRYYSAFAARRGLQPNLSFQHLLTRLTFSVLAGNEASRGYVETNAGDGDWHWPGDAEVYKGVFVKSIEVKSKTTGNIVAAYTGDTPDLITFTDGYSFLNLKSGTRNGSQLNPLYDATTFPDAAWTDVDAMETLLTIDSDGSHGNTNWSKIYRPADLTGDGTVVGGALLVSTEDSYDIKVTLGQYLLDNTKLDGSDKKYKVVYNTAEKTIVLDEDDPTNKFQQGYSYKVKITLYGYEMIKITTTLEKWQDGGNVEVDAE